MVAFYIKNTSKTQQKHTKNAAALDKAQQKHIKNAAHPQQKHSKSTSKTHQNYMELTFGQLDGYLSKLGYNIRGLMIHIYKQMMYRKPWDGKRYRYSLNSFELEKGIYTVILSRIDNTVMNIELEILEITQSSDENYIDEKEKWFLDVLSN